MINICLMNNLINYKKFLKIMNEFNKSTKLIIFLEIMEFSIYYFQIYHNHQFEVNFTYR